MARIAALRRIPHYDKRLHRRLSRQLGTSIKEDRLWRVEEAGRRIEGLVSTNDVKGAWAALRGWYRSASDRPPKPSREDLASVTSEYSNLYTRVDPPGDPIPIVVEPFEIRDDVPNSDEIAQSVRQLRCGKAPGPSKMRAEHLKDWLSAATREDSPDTANWDTLVELVQHVWRTGELPTALLWSALVRLPKPKESAF